MHIVIAGGSGFIGKKNTEVSFGEWASSNNFNEESK